MTTTSGFIPVIPGRRGHRGVAFAPTKRLRELHRFYAEKAVDPTVDERFRLYCSELVDEVNEELRLRNIRSIATRSDAAVAA